MRPGKAFTRFVVSAGLTALIGMGSTAQANTAQEWQFRVYLDDEEIGYHKVRLTGGADGTRVSVEADLDVKFLLFTAYRYRHQTEEIWRGSCIADIQSQTDDNGERLFVRSEPDGDGLVLSTHAGERELSGCIRSFAYWNPELLDASRLLNTQTGEYEEVDIQNLGHGSFEIRERKIEAVQYRLTAGGYRIDLWYTPEMDWLALRSETKDGYQITYVRDRLVQR